MTEPQPFSAFVDTTPSSLRKGKITEDQARQIFEKRLEPILRVSPHRMRQLPSIMVKDTGPYLDILLETRNAFLLSLDYATVAMSGIVAERILKDLLATHLRVTLASGETATLSEEALERLEHADHSVIAKFLSSAGVIGDELKKEFLRLGELRNRYAHGRGKDRGGDSLIAIEGLHRIVEKTVSLLPR